MADDYATTEGGTVLEVLVDTTAYGVDGRSWCPVTRLATGGAAEFPVKVLVPGHGEGQYRLTEIHAQRHRRPGLGEDLPMGI
ncbi:MAG: hypothetical protein ACRDZY_00680 [Acidimicrobiales bacterium]